MKTLPSTAAVRRESPRLIGNSIPMRALRKAIDKVAATGAPVLITGESGTGKELVAHRIHRQSPRADGPFVTVNCPALPSELFQAEVFGYEKGAFTGADRRNPGRIDAARGGTLFLDEIGDLPLDMQVVLLRFLQEGTYERLGSFESIKADVRIIAATHTDLIAACSTGRFREDLYFRLNALHVRTPPLRDRSADIPRLAEHFLEEFSRQLGLRKHYFTACALEQISRYSWPGNVRELRNHILQALVMCEKRELTAVDLDLDTPAGDLSESPEAGVRSLRECRRAAERRAIERALKLTGGNIPLAAEELEISRAQLYRLIKCHGLETNGA